uniref:Vasopressin V1a receptor-like n=1 Tax=Saccoglossus kowalevskii TaxID=10224 RepID=A0ABM0GR85_SACKO|nr:PREDICTED: vasopressin V1a receptor-like [Saccoglossus kowalevskii]
MHLAIADLVAVFLTILPQFVWDITDEFLAPDFVCRVVKYGQVFGMYLPTYVLVMTALDRYMAICHPMSGMKGTQKRTRMMIISAWLLSLLFSIPQAFIFHLVKTPTYSTCRSQWAIAPPAGPRAYITFVTIMVYILPTIFLAWSYGRIWREVAKNAQLKSQWESKAFRATYANGHAHSFPNVTRRTSSNGDTQTNARGVLVPRTHYAGRGITKAKVTMAKMTCVIVVVYFTCWTPYFWVQMWKAWDPDADIENLASVILELTANINCCTNPWIYMSFSGNLIKELRRICCGRKISLFGRTGTNSSDRDYRYGSSRFYKSPATRSASCTTALSVSHKPPGANFACDFHHQFGDERHVLSVSSESAQSRAHESSSQARDSVSLPTTPTTPEPIPAPSANSKKDPEKSYMEMFTSV